MRRTEVGIRGREGFFVGASSEMGRVGAVKVKVEGGERPEGVHPGVFRKSIC
jgi:hypothetical protein